MSEIYMVLGICGCWPYRNEPALMILNIHYSMLPFSFYVAGLIVCLEGV